MVGDHLLAEGLDLGIAAFGLRHLAGVDVDLVRRDDNRGDLSVVRCLGGGWSGREKQRGGKGDTETLHGRLLTD
jgi:hypothetical protein